MAFTHLDLGSAVPGPARPGGFSTAGIELASAAAAAAAGATSAASVLRAMVTGTDAMALDVAFAAVARIASAEDGVSFYADADENKGESSGDGSSGSSGSGGGENTSVADRARLLRVRLDDLHARAPGGCFRHRATLLVVAAVAEALVEGTSERFGALESSERLQLQHVGGARADDTILPQLTSLLHRVAQVDMNRGLPAAAEDGAEGGAEGGNGGVGAAPVPLDVCEILTLTLHAHAMVGGQGFTAESLEEYVSFPAYHSVFDRMRGGGGGAPLCVLIELLSHSHSLVLVVQVYARA